MKNKRRNYLVLLLVAGLLAASLAVIATQPTRLGLDLKGGVSLVYQAKPTKDTKVTGESVDQATRRRAFLASLDDTPLRSVADGRARGAGDSNATSL